MTPRRASRPTSKHRVSRKRRLKPEDVLRFAVTSDARISPDGASIAYVSGELGRDRTRIPRQHIWLVDSDGHTGPRQFTNGPRADFHPRWSPDGRSLAFLSDRQEDGRLDVYLASLEGGEALALTDGGQAVDASRGTDCLQWSVDGRCLYVLLKDPD